MSHTPPPGPAQEGGTSPWSRECPKEPDVYWVRSRDKSFISELDADGDWIFMAEDDYISSEEIEAYGYDFGPRIPSPAALAMAEAALEAASGFMDQTTVGGRLALQQVEAALAEWRRA